MEVCVDCVESAVNAELGGAKRVELCANLVEGGTTPSAGMLRVMKQTIKIPVFVMIRPRGGDFLYTDHEYDVMIADLKLLKDLGADGIVIGILNSDGTIDIDRCKELIDLARPLPVTFHRAIDMTCNISQALEDVIAMGCSRVLTSGGEVTAMEGIHVISDLIQQAKGRITVMPGGGITERNLRRILDTTGAKEFHASARMTMPSNMEYRNTHVTMGAAFSPPEFSFKVTDPNRVKSMISLRKGNL